MSDRVAQTGLLRNALASGNRDEALALVASLPSERRRAVCQPLVPQVKLILGAEHSVTAAAWSRVSKQRDGADVWRGRMSELHWDAATVVLLGSKAAPQAAKVWPLPTDWSFAERIIPALFPYDLDVFVAQWSADLAANPKHWDRNYRRAVMFEWIEQGLVAPPSHHGAVLMLVSGWARPPGKPLLRWLLAHPKVTESLFARIFTTAGIKGASLAQADMVDSTEPMRRVVVPGLVSSGVWTRPFVTEGTRGALRMDLPDFQRRWFLKLADDLAM